MLTGSMLSYF